MYGIRQLLENTVMVIALYCLTTTVHTGILPTPSMYIVHVHTGIPPTPSMDMYIQVYRPPLACTCTYRYTAHP